MRHGIADCRRNLKTRRAIEAVAVESAPVDAALAVEVSRDMMLEQKPLDADRTAAVLGQIPPVVLGRTSHRVVACGSIGLMLVGPRGGLSHLVQNVKTPTMWWHTGTKTWFRSDDGVTFSRAL